MIARTRAAAPIVSVETAAYRIPTDGHEADGTYEWDATTMVVCTVRAGGESGFGYTYASEAAAHVIDSVLREAIEGCDAMAIPAARAAMLRAVRNIGRAGVASMAISALDVALWNLKARLLEVSLTDLLGAARDAVPVYGSGGFTSYSRARLEEQLGGWAREGFARVKMKVGRDPAADIERVDLARRAIGPAVELFVDANGAYTRKQALAQAEHFAAAGASWFEEPVSSDDLEGLRLIRDRAPAGLAIAAGEYGFDAAYFRHMLDAGAVDVLQADASRCGGISGFLEAGALCAARSMPLSAHCVPSLHAAICCALPQVAHLEYFHDHARIEHMLFDGALTPVGGELRPDRERPGLGLEFRRTDAERFAI